MPDAHAIPDDAPPCVPVWAALDAVEMAAHAIEVNPANDPLRHVPVQAGVAGVADVIQPDRLAVLTGAMWPTGTTLRVGFEGGSTAVRDKVLGYAREWSKTANLDFDHATTNLDILVGFARPGYWSYLGAPSRMFASRGDVSLNLQGFDGSMPDSEWRRVVPHEFGHALGFPHEHLAKSIRDRLDPDKVYRYFGGPPNNWSRSLIDSQILDPPTASDWRQGTVEEDSIMCYTFGGNLTKDGRPIVGGTFLTDDDRATAGSWYAGRVKPPVEPDEPPTSGPPRLLIGGPGVASAIPAPGGFAAYRFAHTGRGLFSIEVAVRAAGNLEPVASLGQPGEASAKLKFRRGKAAGIKASAGEYELRVRHPIPSLAGPVWARVTKGR